MAVPPRIPVRLPLNQRVTWLLTFCVKDRRKTLAQPEVWSAFRAATKCHPDWHVAAAVLMPDHVHVIARPLKCRDQNIANLAAALKRWTRLGFKEKWEWQSGSFDRLLRHDESVQEKWMYLWMNPVRAGLVAEPDQWPFWFADSELG